MRKRIFVYFKRTARSDSCEKNNQKRPGKDSKKPPTTFKVGLFAGQLQLAHRKRFFCRANPWRSLTRSERSWHLRAFPPYTHPDCFLFELRVRMMRARQSRKSFAGVCACEAVQKGALFFYSPDHREEDHYLYLLSVIAVFCCLASFFYFKIFG